MNVINPNNTSHQLKIIPRFYPDGSVSLQLKDEFTKVVTTISIDPVITDGYMYLTFNHTFKNNSNYQVMVSENDEVVYRGKLFATTQWADTQNYKLTNEAFTL